MYKKIFRPDGSVVILVPRKESQSVTWEVMYKVGSRQESADINGVSHFIEHLMFKGTTKRPTTQILSRELDSVGAEYNAFTAKDHTAYYIQTAASDKELGCDMLSDMLHNSLFDPVEMDRERGVIVEELNMYRDNPMMRIDELFEESIFAATPLGRDIGGPREVIKTVPHDKLMRFKNRWYYPGNMVIGVAGAIDEREAVELIDAHFPLGRRKGKASIRPITLVQRTPRVKLETKTTDQVQVMLGFPGYSYTHRDADALMLLSVIMGGTMSSRLFITIRERKGLAYIVRSTSEHYEDTGYFAVHAGLDASRLDQALRAIGDELDRVKRSGVTGEEIRRAKDNIRGRLTLKFEKPGSYLSYVMSQELLADRIMTLEEKLSRIERVTREDIHRVATRVIQWAKATLTVIGPFSDAKHFAALIRR